MARTKGYRLYCSGQCSKLAKRTSRMRMTPESRARRRKSAANWKARQPPETMRVRQIWGAMRKRCSNPKVEHYAYYGGRGIKVCARWNVGENGKTGFECFVADMGPRPSPQHSIDRIDNDGNYEPGNCRWATRKEQQANSSRTIAILDDGRKTSLTDFCQSSGLPYHRVRRRIQKHGQTVEQACRDVLTPDTLRGIDHPCARLTEGDVRAIRARYAAGGETQGSLAREYRVGAGSIWKIVNDVSWRHVR